MRCLLIALAAVVTTSTARADTWQADPEGSRVVVHAFKKGALSLFAHDHHFEVTQWTATVDLPHDDPASTVVQVVLSASSLRDRQEGLSEADRRKVNAQAAGPDVLDSKQYPRIEFRSQRLEIDPGGSADHVRGRLHGTLTIRGRRVPTDVDIEADRGANEWRVRGKARLKQTEAGIKPFSGFGGTVAVKDELEVELVLRLRPGEH
jgi:polyisoprenoid-binding protein YceI